MNHRSKMRLCLCSGGGLLIAAAGAVGLTMMALGAPRAHVGQGVLAQGAIAAATALTTNEATVAPQLEKLRQKEAVEMRHLTDAFGVEPARVGGVAGDLTVCEIEFPRACQLPDNMGQGAGGVLAATSDLNPGAGFAVADDFNIDEVQAIDTVCWWGLYVNFVGGASDCGPGAVPDNFSITYYTDAGGCPGAVFAGPFKVVPAKIGTGRLVAGIIQSYSFEAKHPPVAFGPGCYWIQILNDTTDPAGGVQDCFWLWQSAPPGNAQGAQNVAAAAQVVVYTCPPDRTDYDLAWCLGFDNVIPAQLGDPARCVEPPPPGPNNDLCDLRRPISNGKTPFSTLGATTDGPPVGLPCTEGVGPFNDIWWNYSPNFTGDVIITTCEEKNGSATFDTILVVYDGCECVPLSPLLVCNDDDPNNPCGGGAGGFKSTVTVPVVAGNCYKVRLGGFAAGDSGTGVLSIEKQVPPPIGACCLWDGSCVDGSNAVDCAALAGTYLGDGSVCLGDNDGDGVDDACPALPSGANLFTDPGAFNQALLNTDKRAKASWNFKPNNLPAGAVVGLDDPVNINGHSGAGGTVDPWTNFPPPPSGDCCINNGTPGCEDLACETSVCLIDSFCCTDLWDSVCALRANDPLAHPECDCTPAGPGVSKWPPSVDNVTFQSNLDGLQAPAPNPRGLDGVAFVTPPLFDTNNNLLGANFFADSFDIISGPPAGDNHTAMSLEISVALSGGPGPVFVTVFDKQEIPVAKIKLDIVQNQPESCGDPNAGDCCASNGSPGCDRKECCVAICAADSFCCDTEWDAACAAAAAADPVNCPQCIPPPINNDNCLDRKPILQDDLTPFSTVGATTDGPNPASCVDINQDIWYNFTPLADDNYDISLCGSSYDTTLAVYLGCACPVGADIACNDDFCGLQSQVNVALVGGQCYKIRVGGFDTATGAGQILISKRVPGCDDLACPPGASLEGEPCLVNEDVDITNGGCNSAPNVFGSISCGETVCGTSSTYTVAGVDNRDTDWYELFVPDQDGSGFAQVTATLISEFQGVCFILSGPPGDCINIALEGTIGCSNLCANISTATACVPAPATYIIFVAPGNCDGSAIFSGLPCGAFNDYTLEVSCGPCTPGAAGGQKVKGGTQAAVTTATQGRGKAAAARKAAMGGALTDFADSDIATLRKGRDASRGKGGVAGGSIKKAFLGIIMKDDATIGRVNLFDLGGGLEGISKFTLYSDSPGISNTDISGPLGAGFPDGCVDAFDLGVVLGAWCSTPASGNLPPDPPCAGVGCTSPNFLLADLSGPEGAPDGCVDAFDLAKVLANWCSLAGGNPCGTCF